MSRPALSSRAAFVATVLFFTGNGVVMGTFAGAIPALRERVGVPGPWMAALFVVSGVFAVLSMQTGGRLADRVGARPVALTALAFLATGAVAMAFAPTFWLLLAATAVYGFGNGGVDISMNALGVQVERARPRPVMSFLHGMWAAGHAGGAASILLLALVLPETPRDWIIVIALLLAAAWALTVLGVNARLAPDTERVAHTDGEGVRAPLPPWVWVLALIAIAFGLGEGTAVDWAGLLVQQVAHLDAAQSAAAVVAVMGCLTAIRLVGDRIVAAFGRRRVIAAGAGTAALGYLTLALASPLPMLLLGCALVGLGMGLVAPQVYAIAGHAGGGRVLATVVTFGYVTFLAGPAVIGALIGVVGIQATMLLPAVLLVGLVLLSRLLPTD